MNLGQRIAGALAALSGQVAADLTNTSAALAENSTADANFRMQTENTLSVLGALTTDLKNQIDQIAAQVEAGETVDPAVFADIKAKVDSLDEAFPDAEVAPPAEDPVEEPIVDEGSGEPVQGE